MLRNRRLGAKGSYLTLVRVADRILELRGDEMHILNFKLTRKSSISYVVMSENGWDPWLCLLAAMSQFSSSSTEGSSGLFLSNVT